MYHFQLHSMASAKGSLHKPNEDGYLVTKDQFVMIDGATGRAKNGRRFITDTDCGSDAAWLVQTIIERYPSFVSGHVDLRHHLRSFGRELQTIFNETALIPDDIEKSEVPCAALMAAHIDPVNGTLHIAGLADIEAIIVFKDGRMDILPADPRMGMNEQKIISRLREYQDRHNVPLDKALIANVDFLRQVSSTTNTPQNRGVMNVWDTATAPDESFSHYRTFDGSDVESIIMFTDGISDQYGLFDHQDLITRARAHGLEDLIADIRAIEQADPLGQKYPRTKTSDDATIACVNICAGPC